MKLGALKAALTRRRVVILAFVAALIASGTAAYAAVITAGSSHLATVALSPPRFYPNSVVTTNGGASTGQLQRYDYLTIVFSQEMNASTLCKGAPTQTGTLSYSSATVTITNNAAADGDDLLTITSVPTSVCTDGLVHFGGFDLGSTGYLTSATGTFTNSTVALTQTTTSATLKVTLGTLSTGTYARITATTTGMYTPDAALTDTLGNTASPSTAINSATQF